MSSSRRSLQIQQKPYKHLLSSFFKHKYYFSAFNSLRRQNEDTPTLQDFSSQTTTCNIGLPYPVSSPLIESLDADRCLDLLRLKAEYEQKINSFAYYYKQDKKWLTKKYVKNTKYAQLPKYMIDLCTGQIRDPDEYFTGTYDWYYTGGALDLIIVDDCMYFLHANFENNLCLTYVEDARRAFPLDGLTKSPIYSLKSYAFDNNIFVTVRQKRAAHVLKLIKNADGLSTKILLARESRDVPYIDVKYAKHEACFLDLDRKLQVIDVRRNTEMTAHTFSNTENLSDRFCQADYYGSDSIIFFDRNSIILLDKRSLNDNRFVLNNDFFKCDHLCAMAQSYVDSNYLFVCSVHNVFKLDLREMKVVKKWSHMLATPPLMIKTQPWHDDDELLFISSQNHTERVILCSNKTESNLVQQVPNNTDTLSKTYSSFNLNKERFKFSTSGIAMSQSTDGEADLYTCNCNGDVFKNKITRDRDSSNESQENLNDWIDNVPKKSNVLEVTSLREMSKWKYVFVNSRASPDLPEGLERYTKENSLRNDLLSEIDTYETDFAKIWRDTTSDTTNLISTDEITSNHKVSDWLQSADTKVEDDEFDIEYNIM